MKKKIALICLVVILAMSFAQNAGAINVIMNSSYLSFPDQEPVIVNGTTLVPIRTVAEALGLEVTWDDPTDTVVLKKDSFFIELVIGSTVAKTSSGVKSLPQAPIIINSRTMVPLRFIAEEMGLAVHWNDTYKRIVIVGQVDTTVKEQIEAETDVVSENVSTQVSRPVTDEAVDTPEIEAETDFVEEVAEDVAVTTIHAASSSVVLELPLTYSAEDPDDEESFAYRSIDAFDAQHTYNWDVVTVYESFTDEAATSGIVYIVQELSPYEGEEYDLSMMNAEYPTAPETVSVNWRELYSEINRLLMEQLCADRGVDVPEDYEEMSDEEKAEYLGFESTEEMSEFLAEYDTQSIMEQIPEYVEYMNYMEEYNIYKEEYNIIKYTKDYACRNFDKVYSNATDEEWATFFTQYFNTDVEVRYEGVEILDINNRKIIHATIYAEDPDDEQGVYEYYRYADGDCLITIFGGTLFGSEAAGEVVDVLNNITIQ